MSIKIKALIYLAGLIASAFAGALLFNLALVIFSASTIITALQVGIVGGILYMVYSFIVARLEYEAKIKDSE